MQILFFLLALAVLLAALFGLARLARSAAGAAFAGECEEFLQATGPRRCELSVGLLRHLQRVKPENEIHRIWEEVELPLVQAIPDCPPELKPVLIKRLDALYKTCRNRSYQQRIMTLRNSLVS